MNIAMWVLAGGLLGWVGCSYLGVNEGRSSVTSMVIGALGGFCGGKLVAPLFTTSMLPGDFSLPSLLVAGAVAAAFLAVGSIVHSRWGV
jgi:uncharacterized membrane protein YeaQ/YmgE (transglycosylase-associated protein family)